MKYGILNKNGKQVLPMEYDFIYYADDDYFVSVNFEGWRLVHMGHQ